MTEQSIKQVNAEAQNDNGLVYATLFQRAIAIVIDMVVVLPFILAFNFGFGVFLSSRIDIESLRKEATPSMEKIVQDANQFEQYGDSTDSELEEKPAMTYKEIDKEKLAREAQSYMLAYQFIVIVMVFTYIIYFQRKYNATFGARIMKIMLVAADQDELKVSKLLHRNILALFSFMFYGLGFLPVLLTKEKVALHDILANTRVISLKK